MKIRKHKLIVNPNSDAHPGEEELKEIAQVREHFGLPMVETVTRKCLRCSKDFEAVKRVGNFTCDHCLAFIKKFKLADY